MTTKIAQFAKEQFGIELTDFQLQYIAIVSASDDRVVMRWPTKAGKTTADKVIRAYLQDGLKLA